MLKPDTDNVVPEQTRAQLVKVKGSFCASFKCARDAQSGASQSKYTICCIQMRRQAAPIIISLLVRPADPTDSLCFLLAAAFSLSAALRPDVVFAAKSTHTRVTDSIQRPESERRPYLSMKIHLRIGNPVTHSPNTVVIEAGPDR